MNELMDDEQVQGAGKARSFGRTMKLAAAFALVLVIGFAGGMVVNAQTASRLVANVPLVGDSHDATPDSSIDFTDFWKAYNILNTRFVQTHASTTAPTSKDKLWGAIEGMTSSFQDPYTVFMPPQQAKDFADQIRGDFEGVGMEIGIKDGVITVIAPLKNTPAERAGLRAGDAVISIDARSTEGMSTDVAVNLIRGPKGTTVTFKIVRDGVMSSVPVVRDVINVPTIDNSLDTKTGVYTIALYTFTASSGDLFDKALAGFLASGSHLLIIDLRGDPGGYLDAAVHIASHFLPHGDVVVTEDYKGTQENLVHRSTGTGGVPQGTKVVVLIDQGSASASEILSGALQDDHVATLIGTRSFGKGSVQELINIDGGSLKVTVARWLTPLGRSISDGGLTPDIKVDRTQADATAGKDPQKDRAIQFLTTGL